MKKRWKKRWRAKPLISFCLVQCLEECCRFCSLIKGITPKIRMLSFVLRAFFWTFHVFGSCFRTLAVILVSDCCQKKWSRNKEWLYVCCQSKRNSSRQELPHSRTAGAERVKVPSGENTVLLKPLFFFFSFFLLVSSFKACSGSEYSCPSIANCQELCLSDSCLPASFSFLVL